MAAPERDADGKPTGRTYRDHLEAAAETGSVNAKLEIAGEVECPPAMEYLVGWAYGLYGRSGGLGMEGAYAPLSYTTVEAWTRLMDVPISPLEVEALMQLDSAIRNPGDAADDGEKPSAPEADNADVARMWAARGQRGQPAGQA